MTDETNHPAEPEIEESELIRVRREKLGRITELGYDAFPTTADVDTTVVELVANYEPKTHDELEAEKPRVKIAGRIMTIRAFGKAAFLVLSEKTGRVQAYVRKDSVPERDWKLYENLDAGDWVAVEGTVFRTKTNELSVKAERLHFLVKALRPLPSKWHGLTDMERRYRQRYVDLIVNDDVKQTFLTRAKIVKHIRDWFDNHGFIEVETPMMQPIAGGAAARPFVTHHNALDMELFLRIAPELYLKRLIVGGLQRVYEINRNFRNEGISQRHNPEFTMLEFYQAYADYEVLIDETEDLFNGLARAVHGKETVTYRGTEISFARPFARYSMKEAIVHFSEGKIGSDQLNDELNGRAHLVELVLKHGEHRAVKADGTEGTSLTPRQQVEAMNDGKLIAELFESIAEEHLIQPTFITDFPTEVSPLSKQRKDDPNYVERFELYIGGMEVANAFSELNDADEQGRRFAQQIAEREHGDDEAHQADDDYVNALEYGMPPTGGEGIGIDRLAMILTDSASIRDVILFPLMRPLKPGMGTKRVAAIGKKGQQEAFLLRHAEFFARIDGILELENAAFNRTLQASGFTDPVIFYLGIRSVQDFNAIALLAANGDALPAQALIRGMYERVVTSAHLHANPSEAEAFAEFDYVQRHKVARLIKDTVTLTAEQDEQFEQLRKEFERVKERFLVTNCEKCKTKSVGPSWSKLSFVAMASKLPPLDSLLVPAYYEPLSQAHSTLKSISSVLSAIEGDLVFRKDYTAQADETFHLAYLLLMHVFKIQSEHFKLPGIEAALKRAIADYLSIYPNT